LLAIEAARELEFRASSFAPVTDPSELARMFKDPMTSMVHLKVASGPPPSLVGIELDPARLGTLVAPSQGQGASRRTYRVVARADVGKVKHRITAIWDSRKIKQFTANPDKPGDAQGAWVYFRED
jgi:hypothetical protein